MTLTNHRALARFLQTHPAATIAVSIDENGSVHTAPLLYWHSERPLSFYFVTDSRSEKCKLLNKRKSLPAACVVGTERGTPFMLQMRGVLEVIEDPSSRILDAYYAKRKNHTDDIQDKNSVCLRFTPTWARYTDYSEGYAKHMLNLT